MTSRYCVAVVAYELYCRGSYGLKSKLSKSLKTTRFRNKCLLFRRVVSHNIKGVLLICMYKIVSKQHHVPTNRPLAKCSNQVPYLAEFKFKH